MVRLTRRRPKHSVLGADDDHNDDTTSSTSSDLSGRGIRFMSLAHKMQSRGTKRAAVSKDNQAQANQGLKRQMLEMLGKTTSSCRLHKQEPRRPPNTSGRTISVR